MDFASSTRAAKTGLGGNGLCKVICGAPMILQGYEIDKTTSDNSISIK